MNLENSYKALQFVVVILALYCGMVGQSSGQISVTVRGKIVQSSAGSQYGINNVRVSLLDGGGRLHGIAVSGEDGVYYLERVLPGRYQITLNFGNRVLGTYPVNIPNGASGYYDLPPIVLAGERLRSD